jgi:hypothetical protein
MEVNCNAAASEVMSTLSESSSRTEHMAFWTNVMGMDPASAALLYRAERLQEKGQVRQAIKYYESVLLKSPECTEAIGNIRILKELVTEEDKETIQSSKTQQHSLPTVPEKSEVRPTIITEMDVSWTAVGSPLFDDYPDPDDCAFRAAKEKLREIDHGDSLLKLLDNKTLTEVCNHETGGDTVLSGRARFQVTLIPDRVINANPELEAAIYQALMAKKNPLANPTVVIPKTSSKSTADANGVGDGEEETPVIVSVPKNHDDGVSMSSTASQFADASDS